LTFPGRDGEPVSSKDSRTKFAELLTRIDFAADLGSLPPGGAEQEKHLKEFQKLDIHLIHGLNIPFSNKEVDRQNYRLYCRAMASNMARYHQRWFQLGNEPSSAWAEAFGGLWNARPPSPWVFEFCAMVRAGARGIKEGNLQALVSTGGGVLPASYRILDEGLGSDFAAITDHPYSRAGLPEQSGFGGEVVGERDGVHTAGADQSFLSTMTMLNEKCVTSGNSHLNIWVTEWGVCHPAQSIGTGGIPSRFY